MRPTDNNSSGLGRCLEANVGRLLSSAFPRPQMDRAFDESLRQEMARELCLMSGASIACDDDAVREGNLGRLLVSATMDDAPGLVARQSIRNAMWREIDSRRRRPGALRWVPRVLAAAVPVIAVAGFLLYPLLWTQSRAGAELTVTHHEVEVTSTRPFFFWFGSRVSSSSVSHGESLTVHSGDVIRTGTGSAAALSLFGRGSVTLYPESLLRIEEMGEAVGGETPSVTVSLDAGQVINRLTDVIFELRTADATVLIDGTVFKVEVIEGVHTNVSTDEGIVRVDADGHSVEVGAGEEVVAVRGQPLVVLPQRPPSLVISSPSGPEVYGASVLLQGLTRVDASVTVNGRSVPVAVDGSFESELTLLSGANRVVVVATSPVGKSVTVELVLVREE